jgi:cholesterol transport system auxiliary component
MKKIFKPCIALIGTAMLASCFGPVKTAPEMGYVINSAPSKVVKSRRHSATLLVLHPETNPAYNTTRMAFTMHPYQISYYSQSRWIEAPADMLAPLISQTMQNTNRFKSVISPPFTGSYDYALRTQIKMLQIDYVRDCPLLQLDVQAQFIRGQSGNVMATRAFKVAVPLEQRSPYGAVKAANLATSLLLTQMAVWVVNVSR